MKPEDTFLFLAARQNPSAAEQERMVAFARSRRLDWETVFLVAGQQGIGPLLYDNTSRQPELKKLVPEEVLAKARQNTLVNAFLKKERTRYLVGALRFLRERGIHAIIIKGASLDLLVYEQPWYTDYFDTDLILSARKDALPEQTVREIHHFFYRKRVEYDFYEHHDFNMNGMVPVDFNAVWRDARPVQVLDEEALVLSPADQLLSICINSCRKRFFRLKALLDIRETLRKTPDLDWKAFAARCRQFECGNIAFTALYVTRRTLGLDLPPGWNHGLGVSALHRALIGFNVRFLMAFWSMAANQGRSRLFNRSIDPRLILPYATYHPEQILHKAHEINEVRREKE